jgi:hypothetical protein
METLIALGLGSLASYLQGAKASTLKKWQLFAISFGACLLVGILTTALPLLQDKAFDINSLMGNIGVAFTASQTFYNLYFKKLT